MCLFSHGCCDCECLTNLRSLFIGTMLVNFVSACTSLKHAETDSIVYLVIALYLL
jgi:hypothetical protein